MKKILFAGIAVCSSLRRHPGTLVVPCFRQTPRCIGLEALPARRSRRGAGQGRPRLTQYFDRKFRIWVPISSLPDIVIQAVVTAEDDTFFAHDGVNYKATWDAFVHDMQKRRFARGGSTITQQMIKNVLLTREKTMTRKLREYVLARKAEEMLTKRQILQIYLNEVEWGDNIYGIEAASRFYFDKHASDLSSAEAALLAGMLPNPRFYNPYKRPDKAKKRQEQVLFNMHQAKLIPTDEYQAGSAARGQSSAGESGKIFVPVPETCREQACYHYALEQVLVRLFGDQQVYRGGLNIRTSSIRGFRMISTGLRMQVRAGLRLLER